MQNKKNIAMTLVEILVTLIIIAILVALALPQFSTMRERSLSKEAKANLKLIDAAEKIYRMEEGFYYPYSSSVSDQQAINANLKIAVTEGNWGYDITGNSGASYASVAGRNGAGGYLDCEYSMSDTTAEPSPNGSCP
ncbi:MAG: type II secretion system protein [Candidatus Omnitrophota bacterium]